MKVISILALSIMSVISYGQENLTYQKPPKEIMNLVDVERAPGVLIDDKGENMIFIYSDGYKTIAELSEPELRLGGLRINPATNINSRQRYYNQLKVQKLIEKAASPVSGIPVNSRMSNLSWSPNQAYIGFTITTEKGVELWMLDVAKKSARKLTSGYLNANLGNPIHWFGDNANILATFLPADKGELINTADNIPTGPTVTESSGEKAQNRTYQDLLKNPTDEYNFEQLTRSELKVVNINGDVKNWAPANMYSSIDISPNSEYVMVTVMKKPFSYIVPYYRFPTDEIIFTAAGKQVRTFYSKPLIEEMPKGFMATQTGKRNISWRADQGATLYWAEALDNGDPDVLVDFRDAVYQVTAPFDAQPTLILKTIQRFSGIQWSNENLAFANDYWWNTRNTKTYMFNPTKYKDAPELIEDRNYQDNYSDPGRFVYTKNQYKQNVVMQKNGNVYLLGEGYTKEGQFPFIDAYDIATKKKTRMYGSTYTNQLERIIDVFNAEKNQYLVRIESATEFPNYYIRTIGKKDSKTQITFFENPFKSIANVHKEVLNYKRDDGVDLTATLYLPVGYDKTKKEKMPMIMWAYPAEFKDKASAGQNTKNPNEFTYPYYGSMVYWVTRGYVVLDDASFPIIGEGTTEPNDNFMGQLVANAKAAIDAVDRLGYIDRRRVAVGGHSYGAFMTANLLTHCDLFAAGIARSGAYNRTLTPFGFQSEERSYWEAPEVYNTMSPFQNADKMKHPLLLIHGEADNNSGTYPMQSERYFNALKGLGGISRLVILPKESHGYSAKESVLHMLWEQDQWLERFVKNRDKEASK